LPPIAADTIQIRQVLVNIILNASEAIGQEEGTITLTTASLYLNHDDLQDYIHWPNVGPGDYVMLEVRDTGHGMTPEILQKIFDPFFSTKFIGRGLGLAAVLGIVRGHKGAIQVRSQPQNGCTFRVLFPATSGTADVTPAPPPAAITGWKAEGLALVVDDEPPVREIASRMMQKIGFQTITAKDGQEALEQFQLHSAELKLILMDLTMPYVDGLEAFSSIHHQRPDLPVIIMSGYNEQEAIGHQSNRGLAGFLQKPFDLNTLRNKIHQVLEEYGK
jgi:CheY-like chemotaxis protein